MNRVRLPITVLVMSLLLAGCGRPHLMPTPTIFAGTDLDPFVGTTAAARTTTSRVFYATDRGLRENPRNAFETYTTDRSYGLRLGVATVDLAPGKTWEQLHDDSRRGKRRHDPTPHLTTVEDYGPLWTDTPPLEWNDAENETVASRFAGEVQTALDATELNEIFILVHGFNTRFDDNSVVAAELHHFMGERGVFMSYAWPSAGSLFAYSKDKASAAYSIRYFRLFLAYLAERTTARRINIIAHSAGAPVAVEAIRELCLMHYDEEPDAVRAKYRIGHLLLAAPDMDLGIFENAVHDEMVGIPEHMTVYFSTRDKALDFSSYIFGFARLGEPLTELRESDLAFLRDHPAVALIDVAAAEKHHGSWLGHSYFHEDAWVSADVIMQFRFGVRPAARGLVTDGDSPIWIFPEDYPTRADAAAARLYGAGGSTMQE